MKHLVILYSVCLARVSSSSPCTEEQHRSMQQEFSSCRLFYNQQFHLSEGKDANLCTLLSQIIDVCSQKWKRCHSTQEITKMKDLHTEAFIQTWGGERNIEPCSTVLKYRESVRSEIGVDEDGVGGCNDEDSTSAMKQFQTCSHTISSRVFSSILDLSNPELMVDSLCRGLHNISTQCPVHLQTCFAPEDVQQINIPHLEEMKEFFSRILTDRVPKNALDSCDPTRRIDPAFKPTLSPREVLPGDVEGITDFHAVNTEDTDYPDTLDKDETNDIEKYEEELDLQTNDSKDRVGLIQPETKQDTSSIGNEWQITNGDNNVEEESTRSWARREDEQTSQKSGLEESFIKKALTERREELDKTDNSLKSDNDDDDWGPSREDFSNERMEKELENKKGPKWRLEEGLEQPTRISKTEDDKSSINKPQPKISDSKSFKSGVNSGGRVSPFLCQFLLPLVFLLLKH